MGFTPDDIKFGDEPKKSKPGFKPSDIQPVTSGEALDAFTGNGNTNAFKFDEFGFQPKTNADNYKLRAQNQSGWQQLGRTVGNLLPNIATGIVAGLGYTAELFDGKQDYTNPVIDLMESWKNPFGEVYRENPEEVFDLGDPAWWYTNVGGLVESAAEFAIPGALEAKVLGNAAKALSTVGKLGKTGQALTMATANTLTSAHLAYMEGAMTGRQVYKDAFQSNYDRFIRQGIDPVQAEEQAKELASKGAAAAVRISTTMNTVLNMASLAPLFKTHTNRRQQWLGSEGARKQGEALGQWESRIKSMDFTPEIKELLRLRPKTGITSHLAQAFNEGVEETNTYYAQRKGEEIASGDPVRNVNFLSDYFDKVSDQEGALNFVLGAVGGPAQSILVDNLPVHTVVRYDSEGKPMYKADPKITTGDKGQPQYQTQRVSSRTRDSLGNRQYFENAKDAILKDISWFNGKQTELQKAIAAKNTIRAEQIREEMASIGSLNAIMTGTADGWKQQYEAIKNLSQEDAVKSGYAIDENDTAYKQRATQAIQDLDWAKKRYDDLVSNYTTDDPHSEELTHHIFAREVEQKLNKRIIDKEEQELMSAENLFKTIDNYQQQTEINSKVAEALNSDREKLIKAVDKNNFKGIIEIAGKYGINVNDDSELPSAINKLVRELERKVQEHKTSVSNAEQLLQSDSGFIAWSSANPQKGFDSYLKYISENKPIDPRFAARKIELEKVKAEYEIREQNLAALRSTKGQQNFLNAAAKHQKAWKREVESKNLKANLDNIRAKLDKDAAATLSVKQHEAVAAEVQKDIAENISKTNELKDKLTELETQLKEVKGTYLQKIKKKSEIKREIQSVIAQIQTLEQQRRMLEAQLENVQQQVVQATEVKQQVEEATQEEIVNNEVPEYTPEGIDPVQNTEVIPDQVQNTATTRYESLASQLPAEVIDALDNLETLQRGMMESGEGYSYDLARASMDNYVQAQIINPDTAHKLIILQKEYLEEQTGAEPVVLITPKEEVPEVPVVEQVQISDPSESMTPITNAAIDPDSVMSAEVAEHISDKALSAMKVNSATIKYMQIEKPAIEVFDTETGMVQDKVQYKFLPLYDQLDETANHLNLVPGAIKAGDKLQFVVDTEFSGEVNFDRMNVSDEYGNPKKREEKFTDHTTETGKIIMNSEVDGYANVPVKIVHVATGDVIGYLPRAGWVTSKFANATNFRNIEDTPTVDAYKKRAGNNPVALEGNVAKQQEMLLAIRKKIAEAFNEGKGQTFTSTVAPRQSAGHLFYNTTVNRNTERYDLKPLLAKNLLPDTSLQFGLISKGVVYTAAGIELDGDKQYTRESLQSRFGSADNAADNIPVVVLPMPNGKLEVSPLYTKSLGDRPAEINTIARVIEAYMAFDTEQFNDDHAKIIEAVRKATTHEGTHRGLDITDEKDLELFLNQYFTYTRHFADAHTRTDAPGNKKPRFMIDIPVKLAGQKKSQIKIGTSWSGKAPLQAALFDGRLSEDFEAELKEGLASHYKNVVYTRGDIRGLNDNRPFNSIIIQTNGTPRVTKHVNYNEYLKSFADTIVYGKHKIGRDGKPVPVDKPGTFVYGANPVIEFDFSELDNAKILRSTSNTDLQTAATAKAAPAKSLLKGLRVKNGILNPDSSTSLTSNIGTIEGSTPATLDNLTNLHNNTPADKRNGKSPQQVLNEMHSLGIIDIAPNLNPFLKC